LLTAGGHHNPVAIAQLADITPDGAYTAAQQLRQVLLRQQSALLARFLGETPNAMTAQTLGIVLRQDLRVVPIQQAQHHRLLLTAVQRLACTLARRYADIAHLPGLQGTLLGFGEIDLVDHIDQDIGFPGGDPCPLHRQMRQTCLLALVAQAPCLILRAV
jgi:hypothetical protein